MGIEESIRWIRKKKLITRPFAARSMNLWFRLRRDRTCVTIKVLFVQVNDEEVSFDVLLIVGEAIISFGVSVIIRVVSCFVAVAYSLLLALVDKFLRGR